MRRISFALTRDSFLDGSKTVTRRKGWKNLKPGDRLLAVSKCMGLKLGESAEVYGPIEVVSVRREELISIAGHDVDCMPGLYAGPCNIECCREGFENMLGADFVEFFCEHMGGDDSQLVTRIEFRRVEPRALDGVRLSPAMRSMLSASRSEEGTELKGNFPTIAALFARGLARCRGEGFWGNMWVLTDLGRQVADELREGGL